MIIIVIFIIVDIVIIAADIVIMVVDIVELNGGPSCSNPDPIIYYSSIQYVNVFVNGKKLNVEDQFIVIIEQATKVIDYTYVILIIYDSKVVLTSQDVFMSKWLKKKIYYYNSQIDHSSSRHVQPKTIIPITNKSGNGRYDLVCCYHFNIYTYMYMYTYICICIAFVLHLYLLGTIDTDPWEVMKQRLIKEQSLNANADPKHWKYLSLLELQQKLSQQSYAVDQLSDGQKKGVKEYQRRRSKQKLAGMKVNDSDNDNDNNNGGDNEQIIWQLEFDPNEDNKEKGLASIDWSGPKYYVMDSTDLFANMEFKTLKSTVPKDDGNVVEVTEEEMVLRQEFGLIGIPIRIKLRSAMEDLFQDNYNKQLKLWSSGEVQHNRRYLIDKIGKIKQLKGSGLGGKMWIEDWIQLRSLQKQNKQQQKQIADNTESFKHIQTKKLTVDRFQKQPST
ncbi:hypothetical protein RFI_29133 [Reticulomyxa filosa]|uniref:Uncharacterized protein n=1 Tax=Reticulomyxa filosa TaxID=46433 RepID=X6M5E8_RETFI|nr:hypothetical protein RFI_29133 [Reticulomyxa filosa]|eukprot:ETO08255.1 hypothetical protein RFI_29133 [Reticulomyxa filosa]